MMRPKTAMLVWMSQPFGSAHASQADVQDCHAMGAQASAALMLAMVPHATERQQEEELFQMLAGAAAMLGRAGCCLLGGHSSEGSDAAFGTQSYHEQVHMSSSIVQAQCAACLVC